MDPRGGETISLDPELDIHYCSPLPVNHIQQL
jgi:hypothetical protein